MGLVVFAVPDDSLMMAGVLRKGFLQLSFLKDCASEATLALEKKRFCDEAGKCLRELSDRVQEIPWKPIHEKLRELGMTPMDVAFHLNSLAAHMTVKSSSEYKYPVRLQRFDLALTKGVLAIEKLVHEMNMGGPLWLVEYDDRKDSKAFATSDLRAVCGELLDQLRAVDPFAWSTVADAMHDAELPELADGKASPAKLSFNPKELTGKPGRVLQLLLENNHAIKRTELAADTEINWLDDDESTRLGFDYARREINTFLEPYGWHVVSRSKTVLLRQIPPGQASPRRRPSPKATSKRNRNAKNA